MLNGLFPRLKRLRAPEFGYRHIDIAIDEVTRGEFRATQIDVTSTAAEKRHGGELIAIVEKAAAGIYMSDKARAFASKVIRTIIEAEADLHKTSFEDAHLHEVALDRYSRRNHWLRRSTRRLAPLRSKNYLDASGGWRRRIQVFPRHRLRTCTRHFGDFARQRISRSMVDPSKRSWLHPQAQHCLSIW